MKLFFTTYLVMNLILETLAADTLIGGAMGVFSHALMAVIAIYCYSQRAKWCTK